MSIHANPMGSFVGGEAPRADSKVCPICGGLMSWHSTRCTTCNGKYTAEQQRKRPRDTEMMDDFHLWEVLRGIGFTDKELWSTFDLFSWESVWAAIELVKSWGGRPSER